jgi:arylsulfatase A-like enzyme/Flp pilus assembly protein TadD
MPSARKRAARSPTPRGPARTPRDTDAAVSPRRSRAALARLALLGLVVAVVAGAAIVAWVWVERQGGGWASLAGSHGGQADLRAVPGQNVLLITIDTLRADALSSYGGPASTPALDRLAGDGVRFTFAHAHAVLTLPSHTSILTGTYPYQHGVRENSGYRLAPGSRTLATILKRAGYATGAFLGAFPLHSRFGLNQGFDAYDDRFGETRAPTEFVMPERPATEVVPLARDWIAKHQQQRWFSWVHVFDPHAPYRPPPPFDRQYANQPYYGEVAATDAALAPLLDDVRMSGRPTIVVVTGDHGEALGDHGEESHGLFAYESTLRIPLIIAEEGTGAPRATGEVSSVPARHVDVLPTILDATGQPTPAGLPGRTLLPAAERRDGSSGRAARTSYFESMAAMLNRGWAPLTGVLANRDKYIDLPIPERYDLARDPGEQTNLAGRLAERDRALQASLRAFGAAMPGDRLREDPEAVARLRALGYVSGNPPVKGPGGAAAHYTEADDPKGLVDIDQAVHRGVQLYGNRQFDAAADVYRQIIARRPDMAIAYRHLAFVEWERGNVRGALDVMQRAVRAGITHEGLLAQFASYLAESGSAAEAIRLIEPVATNPAADADTLNALGIAYARDGRPADATRVFDHELEVNPDSAIPLENLGVLALERGDVAAARMRFERAVRVDPRSSQAFAGLGVVALRNGDRKGAIAAWRQAVQLDPTNYDALYNLGTTLRRDGQPDAARPYLEQFVRSAPQAFYAKDIRTLTAILQSPR